jgi:hypothetical protein
MRGRPMNAWGTRAAALAGLGAILFTAGCGAAQNGAAGTAQSAATQSAATQPGAPVVVGCEPNQRTLVRSTVVNGVAVSQVDCVSNVEQTAYVQSQFAQPAAVPASYYAAPHTVAARQAELGDTRIIPAASYPVAARPVRTQQVVYDDDRPARVVKRGRSVKKSAIIIGSSAGVGAGVGAAVGGKKGALIGAVVGGGGATLWDQITRRKD